MCVCVCFFGIVAARDRGLLNRTCFGKLDNKLAYYPKVTLSENLPAFLLIALIFFLGVAPNYLVRWTETTTNSMVATLPATEQIALQK
jgi:NAD(P)H-quinone oxidoreductase subunit 4